jgi:glycosyltransferase involved in cell wall biosynthesis
VTAPDGPPVQRVTLIMGTTAGGTGTHVAMLTAGLAARGIAVTVAGPSAAGARLDLDARPGVSFIPVEIGSRPRPGDIAVLARLRRLLDPGPAGPGGHVVHAHGVRAGALAVLARPCRGRRPPVVVTVHNGPPAGGAAARAVYRLLERVVARGADQVLCVSGDLEHRMRAAGARRVGRAVIAAADPQPGPGLPLPAGWPEPGGRPVVLAAGRLAAQKGIGTLLDAAVAWRDLDPPPLVVIAGDGPLAASLRRRSAALGLDPLFAGPVADVPALLAAAAVFVLPSQWEGQPLVLQEALRAGRPVVASRAGGIPALTGDGAALLVPPGDAPALAAAVRSVLTDASLAARLRAAAAVRAAALPTEAAAVAAALSAYAALGRGPGLR